MRTTVTIDDQLLAEAKLIAARSHRTIGSVLEDALRRHIAEQGDRRATTFALPDFSPTTPGMRPGVDLLDREVLADLLGDNERDAAS